MHPWEYFRLANGWLARPVGVLGTAGWIGGTLFDRACGLLLLGVPAGGGLAICTGALCYAWLELLKLL